MILKRMDETILSGQYEAEGNDAEKTVLLVEPEIIKQDNTAPDQSPASILKWKMIEERTVSKSLLYYDDTIDTSHQTYLPSWKKYYQSNNNKPPYAGGDCIYRGGAPRGSEITKLSAYLRYSCGFINFVKEFDFAASKRLAEEAEMFSHVKNLAGWSGSSDDFWVLPILARLSTGKYIVLGLQADLEKSSDSYDDLNAINIDVDKSLQIMELLRKPERNIMDKIVPELQMRSGLGRNPFGWGDSAEDIKNITTTEVIRLHGIIPGSSIQEIKECWKNHNLIEYKHIRFSPNPSQSSLLFLPEGDYKYEELEDDIRKENERYDNYSKKKKRKSKTNDDKEEIVSQRPSPLPMNYCATVYMVNLEGNNQKKLIVQQIIPSVLMRYFSALNQELMFGELQNILVKYMKTALTGQYASDTPSVYVYWTHIFTKTIQKQYITARPLYESFQRYAGNISGKKLIDEKEAAAYFKLIRKMLRLSCLISVARESPDRLGTPDLIEEFNAVETLTIKPKQGVFGKMTTDSVPSGKEILGESYSFLRDRERQKFDSFIKLSYYGVPNEDFKIFSRGALIGMLLQNLCWNITREGRRFSVTEGRHPSRLRGAEITALFVKGIGLLQNLGKTYLFNSQMLPFIKSVEEESRRDAFNSGMIMGMVYFEPKEKDVDDGNDDQPTNTISNKKL